MHGNLGVTRTCPAPAGPRTLDRDVHVCSSACATTYACSVQQHRNCVLWTIHGNNTSSHGHATWVHEPRAQTKARPSFNQPVWASNDRAWSRRSTQVAETKLAWGGNCFKTDVRNQARSMIVSSSGVDGTATAFLSLPSVGRSLSTATAPPSSSRAWCDRTRGKPSSSSATALEVVSLARSRGSGLDV